MALVAIASVTLTSNAHAQDTIDPNTSSGTTQHETELMREDIPSGGSIRETVVVLHVAKPAADATAITMHNPVKINKMFGEIKDTKTYDVLELARTSPNLSTFVELIERANLVDDLQRLDSVTLFAPTNEAFAKVPQAKLDALLDPENKALLSRMLQTHVLAAEVPSALLNSNTRIRVTSNSYIPVKDTKAGTAVGGAWLVKPDVKAANGRIHVIDSVILPSENLQQGRTW